MYIVGARIVSFDVPARLAAAARFVPLCQRQYRIEPVEVNSFTDALPQGESPDLVRFLLTGECPLAPDLAAGCVKIRTLSGQRPPA